MVNRSVSCFSYSHQIFSLPSASPPSKKQCPLPDNHSAWRLISLILEKTMRSSCSWRHSSTAFGSYGERYRYPERFLREVRRGVTGSSREARRETDSPGSESEDRRLGDGSSPRSSSPGPASSSSSPPPPADSPGFGRNSERPCFAQNVMSYLKRYTTFR